MNSSICKAITGRKVIEFSYKDHHRIVEPFCHGMSRTGNEVLRGYQIGGTSESGVVPDWKMFSVEKIEGLRDTGQVFQNIRPDYNPDDKHMTEICCNI